MKDVAGFEGIYAVTKDGMLWSYGGTQGANHNGKFIKVSKDKDGYRRATLRHKGNIVYKRIGRLVLETYRPNISDKNMQVNHKNGIRADDRLENLEWVTASENIRHSFEKLGKNQKCSNNNCFKEWGFYDMENNIHKFVDKSVDTWCKENNISSSTVYSSMKRMAILKKGKFKGYRFFRISEEIGSTGN